MFIHTHLHVHSTETTVELRRSKKEDQIQKRRNFIDSPTNATTVASPTNNTVFNNVAAYNAPPAATQVATRQPTDPGTQQQIIEQREYLMSNDPAAILRATQQFRRLLSIEHKPPIQQVIDSGVVPRFV